MSTVSETIIISIPAAWADWMRSMIPSFIFSVEVTCFMALSFGPQVNKYSEENLASGFVKRRTGRSSTIPDFLTRLWNSNTNRGGTGSFFISFSLVSFANCRMASQQPAMNVLVSAFKFRVTFGRLDVCVSKFLVFKVIMIFIEFWDF